ncbi:MAG: universal stress protein [Deltaproteobacteria bacterium]|nr:universal stress protein [Deltaproteobacteria bacterium]
MTMKNKMVSNFLLPVDGPETFARTARLMGMVDAGLGSRIEKVSLLHVMAGKYLSTHMANVDVRTEFILASELFKRLKKQHIREQIAPKMQEAEQLLRKAGVRAPIDILIEDGEPVQRIAAIAGGYSTIIMERRGLSPMKEVLVGSVTAGLLHRDIHASVYLVGRIEGKTPCPACCCLIPVDGSVHGNAAVAEAAVLLGGYGSTVKEVILVHVLDASRYGEEVSQGKIPAKAGDLFLAEARKMLLDGGMPENIISEVVRFGDPATVLAEEINKRPSCLVFMGRRGRNAVREIFMGSVSRRIVHRCPDHFVALVTAP